MTIKTIRATSMELDNAGTMGGYTRAIAVALQSEGLNSEEIFQQANIRHSESIDPLQRISSQQAARVYQLAHEATGDDYFGLVVGKAIQPGLMHALGYGLLSSTTLSDFFQRIEKYWRIASDVADFKHEVQPREELLVATNISDAVCVEDVDAWMVLMLRLIRMVYQRDIHPRYIELPHSCPPAGPGPYEDFFQCDVMFDCSSARIAIDRQKMLERLPAASEELALQNDGIVMEYLEKLQKADIKTRVYKQIAASLATGGTSNEAIAAKLNMSVRNMQYKLAEKETSFQTLLDQCRQELAMSYIQQSRKSITEIAFLLGFADASSFTRAFRRWTGLSPRQYRSDQQS